MRIVFLLATRNFGGAQRSSLEMANRLSKNHDVLIVEVEGTDEAYLNAIGEFNLKLKKYEGKPGLPGPLRKLTSWYSWTRWLKKVFSNWKPDLVIVKDTKTLSLLNPNAGYKTYFHARAWYASYQISRFKRSTFKRVKPHFMAVSQATRHALFNAGLAPLADISVVPNALNLPTHFERKQAPDNRLRLLHAGGFIASKGQHISIRVAAGLKAAGIPFHLTLVGFVYNTQQSQKYYNELEEYIKNQDLHNEVSLHTGKNRLDELYLENDVLLYPSATEGLPRVVMEAMHYKLAVVANPVGGVIDLIQDGISGYIADYNKIEDFTQRVEQLYHNPELRLRLADKASELIQEGYTEANQMQKMETIISK